MYALKQTEGNAVAPPKRCFSPHKTHIWMIWHWHKWFWQCGFNHVSLRLVAGNLVLNDQKDPPKIRGNIFKNIYLDHLTRFSDFWGTGEFLRKINITSRQPISIYIKKTFVVESERRDVIHKWLYFLETIRFYERKNYEDISQEKIT